MKYGIGTKDRVAEYVIQIEIEFSINSENVSILKLY